MGKRRFRFVDLSLRSLQALGRIVDKRDYFSRFSTSSKNIFHIGAESPQQALHLREALLLSCKRLRVEFDVVTIIASACRHVFDHVTHLAQRLRKNRELGIYATTHLKRGRCSIERIEGTVIAGQGIVSSTCRHRERFCVFCDFQIVHKLLVLTLERIDLVDAAQRETGLIELCRGGFLRILYAIELNCSFMRIGESSLVRSQDIRHLLANPSVKHMDVGCRFHELLMLELATKVDCRADDLRQFAHARHRAIHRRARTPVSPNAARDYELVHLAVFAFVEKTTCNLQGVLAVTHHVSTRAAAHEQLERRKQGRFARTSLARDHREAVARLKRCVADKR